MNDETLQKCIEEIVALFTSDTIEFFDRVLSDDPQDPQFSPNIAYSRLKK